MNLIVSKEYFSENVVKLEIEAPRIAKARRAGHFVIVRVGENGERIPLTIAGSDTSRGTITLVVQRMGVSSRKLTDLNVGDSVTDVVGPLGQATKIEKVGTVLCCGGGVGVAPICCAMDSFATATSRAFFGFRGAQYAYGMTQAPCAVSAVSDDGTLGEKALVTKPLLEAIEARRPDLIMACGPTPMLAAVQRIALERGIPCQLSLEERMACGIGACLGCATPLLREDGSVYYGHVCKDGPVFDAEKVNL